MKNKTQPLYLSSKAAVLLLPALTLTLLTAVAQAATSIFNGFDNTLSLPFGLYEGTPQLQNGTPHTSDFSTAGLSGDFTYHQVSPTGSPLDRGRLVALHWGTTGTNEISGIVNDSLLAYSGGHTIGEAGFTMNYSTPFDLTNDGASITMRTLFTGHGVGSTSNTVPVELGLYGSDAYRSGEFLSTSIRFDDAYAAMGGA